MSSGLRFCKRLAHGVLQEAHLTRINPVDRFRVAGSGEVRRLEFDNLGVKAGLAGLCDYTYQWYRYDNASDDRSVLTAEATTSVPSLPIPTGSIPFSMVRLTSQCEGQPSWTSPVDVFLRNEPEPTVVGVDRADPDPS